MKKITNASSDVTMPLDTQVVIHVAKPLGLTAKVVIHETARKLPLYDQSLKCDEHGQSDDGKKIKVNTVGRWLFGVPGYDGHIRIVSDNNKILLYYPKKSQGIIHEFIASLIEAVETK